MPSVLGRATNNALGSLEHWWNTPVDRRYNILPLAEQPDGSTVPAVPGLIAEPFNALARVMANAGRRETTYDDAGVPISGVGALHPGDGLNAVGLAPMGNLALGAIPHGVGVFGGRLAKTAEGAADNGLAKTIGPGPGTGAIIPKAEAMGAPLAETEQAYRAFLSDLQENDVFPGYQDPIYGMPTPGVDPAAVRGAYEEGVKKWHRVPGVDPYGALDGPLGEDLGAVMDSIRMASEAAGRSLDVKPRSLGSQYGHMTTPAGNQWSVRVADHANQSQHYGAKDFNIAPGDMTPSEFLDLLPTIYANPESSSSVPLALSMAQAERPTYTGPGITAYHGSPHDFDRFDLSKIGTGEGAQAYGHGLYFAENEGVAKAYRDQLGSYDGAVKWKGDQPPTPAEQSIMSRLSGFDVARNEAASLDSVAREIRQEIVRERLNEGAPGWDSERSAQRIAKLKGELEALNGMKDKVSIQPPGRMYQVRINADPESFLDWDKPLSQQSEKVRDGMTRLANGEILPADTGEQAYRSAAMQMGLRKFLEDPELSARVWREEGIPGIRYLDQGSRSAGEGSSNYVVFDDSLVDILRKYANPETASSVPLALSQDSNDTLDMNELLRRYWMIP